MANSVEASYSSEASGKKIINTPSGSLSSGRDESIVSSLRQKIIEMDVQLVDLKERFKRNDPKVVQLENTLHLLKDKLNKEVLKSSADEGSMILLTRKRQSAEKIYLELLNRYEKINVFLDTNWQQDNSKKIIASPFLPERNLAMKYFIALFFLCFFEFMICICSAFVLEAFDRTFRNENDVARFLGLKVICNIPLIEK